MSEDSLSIIEKIRNLSPNNSEKTSIINDTNNINNNRNDILMYNIIDDYKKLINSITNRNSQLESIIIDNNKEILQYNNLLHDSKTWITSTNVVMLIGIMLVMLLLVVAISFGIIKYLTNKNKNRKNIEDSINFVTKVTWVVSITIIILIILLMILLMYKSFKNY